MTDQQSEFTFVLELNHQNPPFCHVEVALTGGTHVNVREPFWCSLQSQNVSQIRSDKACEFEIVQFQFVIGEAFTKDEVQHSRNRFLHRRTEIVQLGEYCFVDLR